MKTAAILPVLNQHEIANQALEFLSQDSPRPYELIVLDNGSDPEFKTEIPEVDIVRNDTLYGPYQSLFIAPKITEAEILAFFHSDVFVYEEDWWKRVEESFDADPQLGLIGFIGSNEIDWHGGRGLGTVGNFQGRTVHQTKGPKEWSGSAAEVHGKRSTGLTDAAVVDGCVMIFRRNVLEKIKYRENFPPHHFYDRLLSCEVQEQGYKVAVLGIGFDHVSGQTANQENAYHQAAKEWCTKHHVTPGGIGTNWDHEIYKEAERQWLREYREEKKFIPRKV